ncbi:MAG: ribbon-helix-helix domain-containing protein [Methanophagales archaeon]|nr:ribbon-helix-helix domain-containing protein [Methanophagales archaeon]
MKTKSIFLPPIRVNPDLIKELYDLVGEFRYRSRSDIVREAIMDENRTDS